MASVADPGRPHWRFVGTAVYGVVIAATFVVLQLVTLAASAVGRGVAPRQPEIERLIVLRR